MDTLRQLLAQLENIADLTNDELAQLDADIVAAAEEVANGEHTTDTLAALSEAADAVEQIRTEGANRSEAQAEADAAAADALARIRGAQDDDGEPDADEVDTEPVAEVEDDVEAEVVDLAPTEPDAPTAEEPAEAEPEAVAADAAPRRLPPLTRVAARRPAEASPRSLGNTLELGLTASANAPGLAHGQPIADYDQLADAFIEAFKTAESFRGPRTKVSIARAGNGQRTYPESHRLGMSSAENNRKIATAQAAARAAGGVGRGISEGLTASGGVCAPSEVRYDMPVLGDTDRPVRDQFLMRFAADRGGISTLPPPELDDLDGVAAAWTNANDQNPSSPATKPCVTVTCPSESETTIEAITRCIQYGNFRSRFLPEQIEAWMRLAAVEHARYAEERLLAAISTGSSAVTSGQVLGTTRDVLATLDRVIAIWRYRHRDDGMAFSFAAPVWLKDQIRTDIARQLPVGTVDETLALADAQIEGFFRSRGIDPVWILDGESGQQFTVQGVGPLQGWPSTVKTYLAPAGNWLFLDGGTLDLGIVRDSTLNSTNDVQVFAETFEAAHFHGVDSWTLAFDTCPDGAVSAAVDIDPCTSGS